MSGRPTQPGSFAADAAIRRIALIDERATYLDGTEAILRQLEASRGLTQDQADYRQQLLLERERLGQEREALQANLEPPPREPTEPSGDGVREGTGTSLHAANQSSQWRAITCEPDFCRVGPDIVAFDSSADLSKVVLASSDVFAQGSPVYRVGDIFREIHGNAGSHVVSGTSQAAGHVKITSGQDNVLVNGLPMARHGSTCQVNCNAAGVGGALGELHTNVESTSSSPTNSPRAEGFWAGLGAFLAEMGEGFSEHTGEEVLASVGEGEPPLPYDSSQSAAANLGRLLSQFATDIDEQVRYGTRGHPSMRMSTPPPQRQGKVPGKKPQDPGVHIAPKLMQAHTVPCFNAGKRIPDSKLPEYDRQVADQQKAVNNMSVKDFQEARALYQRTGRNPEAAKAQQNARADFETRQFERLVEEKREQGFSKLKAKSAALEEASSLMAGLDALHSPDLIAGGYNNPIPGDFGDRSVNRSIGGQWPQNERVQGIDKAVEKVPKSERSSTKMNVKMSRCPRRGK
ncbi:PAAR motif protein [compost metagenome]